jgi:uncharacterized NAD(P)/FAD-binding protein YdhS
VIAVALGGERARDCAARGSLWLRLRQFQAEQCVSSTIFKRERERVALRYWRRRSLRLRNLCGRKGLSRTNSTPTRNGTAFATGHSTRLPPAAASSTDNGSATQHSLRSGAALFWEDDVAAIAAAVFQPAGSEAPPIVVIGAGPSGLRVVQELLRQGVERPIVLCGAETYQP